MKKTQVPFFHFLFHISIEKAKGFPENSTHDLFLAFTLFMLPRIYLIGIYVLISPILEKSRKFV